MKLLPEVIVLFEWRFYLIAAFLKQNVLFKNATIPNSCHLRGN